MLFRLFISDSNGAKLIFLPSLAPNVRVECSELFHYVFSQLIQRDSILNALEEKIKHIFETSGACSIKILVLLKRRWFD